jgi:hypothetical protein
MTSGEWKYIGRDGKKFQTFQIFCPVKGPDRKSFRGVPAQFPGIILTPEILPDLRFPLGG